jgi:hypothetical protein
MGRQSFRPPLTFPPGPGFPIRGFGRAADTVAAERGRPSFGSARESEKAPLAERCDATFGFGRCIAASYRMP